MYAVGLHVRVVDLGEVAVRGCDMAGLRLPGQPGDRGRRQPGRVAEELRKRAKSPEDRPCRQSSGSTSLVFGDLRHQGGGIAEENRLRSPVASSTRLSWQGPVLFSHGYANGQVRTVPQRFPGPARVPSRGHADLLAFHRVLLNHVDERVDTARG